MPSWWRAALELLLPPACAGCGREVAELPFCPACAPQPAGALPPAPAPLAAWCAAILHSGAGAAWVRRFKYPAPGLAGLDPAAEAAAFGLVRRLAPRVPGPRPALVVPVPLHPRRLRERGFSPAALLALALAREARAPCAPVLLARLRDTPSQTALSRAARRRNVAGAFAARGPAPARVWLVDDVATTGSTLAEAARALRRAGAREIVGVCLAWRPPVG
jgi:predicted amidophosphoribosyltransferase